MGDKKNGITEVFSLIADSESQGETGGKVTDSRGRLVTLGESGSSIKKNH